MIVEQFYTSCLSQASYYIECSGEVAIIDPSREVDHFIEKASSTNSKIKYIFQTHFHADFVSGHLTLSKLTDAPIVYGPNAQNRDGAHPTFARLICCNYNSTKDQLCITCHVLRYAETA